MNPDQHRSAPQGNEAGFGLESEGESLSWPQVRHLLYAPLRRPLLVLLPWAGVIILSLVALLLLPKRYRSSTLILIESEKVPDSFVPRVATEEALRRIDNIRPEILSRTRLERVLADTHPYPDMDSKTRVVETMRRAITVNPSGSDGFTVEFVHRDPHTAQQVADRLATLFISETVADREQQVEGAVDFLVTQVQDARKELEAKDMALRHYKEQRMGRLPEQLQTNLATLEMFQREMQTVEESLFLARERRDALARGAGRSTGMADGRLTPPGSEDLDQLRRQLTTLQSLYTNEHPDVQSLRSRIAAIEARATATTAAGDLPAPSDTSALIAREQLQRASVDVERLEARHADLERRTAEIRARVEDTPRTEQELATLTRDYQNLSENYTALLNKQLDAQMAGRLEQRWKGARFRVLDPAHLPEKADFPKPWLVVSLGVVLGFLSGLGASVAMELLDPTVKDSESLERLVGYPILARIPHLTTMSGPPAQ